MNCPRSHRGKWQCLRNRHLPGSLTQRLSSQSLGTAFMPPWEEQWRGERFQTQETPGKTREAGLGGSTRAGVGGHTSR